MASFSDEQFKELMERMNKLGGDNGRSKEGRKTVPPLTKTTPDDFYNWRKTFENIHAITQWSNQRARQEAKAAMQGQAAALTEVVDVRADVHEEDTDAAPVKELLDELEEKFLPTLHAEYVLAEFNNLKMHETGETIIL